MFPARPGEVIHQLVDGNVHNGSASKRNLIGKRPHIRERIWILTTISGALTNKTIAKIVYDLCKRGHISNENPFAVVQRNMGRRLSWELLRIGDAVIHQAAAHKQPMAAVGRQ